MILADTSVWIDFFADRPTAGVGLLACAIDDRRIIMGDLVLVEILQGAKTAALQKLINASVGQIPCETLCGPELARQAAANYRLLRQRGITVRGTIDVIIATWCIENRVALLHAARDFDVLEKQLGLVCAQ